MRYFGSLHTPRNPINPDASFSLLLTSAPQAADYPTGTDLVRVTFASTLGAALAGVFNGNSTAAAWGTSFAATAGSSVAQSLVGAGDSKMFQRSRVSTGFSVATSSAGYATVECWSRAGTT